MPGLRFLRASTPGNGFSVACLSPKREPEEKTPQAADACGGLEQVKGVEPCTTCYL